jgi:hypothetical protein
VKIKFNITVFRGEDGAYRARADELGMLSEPCRRNASAVKKLKEMLQAFMKDAAEKGTLTKQLDEVGYVWSIGADFIYVDAADSLVVKLPLPRNRGTDEANGKEDHAR